MDQSQQQQENQTIPVSVSHTHSWKTLVGMAVILLAGIAGLAGVVYWGKVSVLQVPPPKDNEQQQPQDGRPNTPAQLAQVSLLQQLDEQSKLKEFQSYAELREFLEENSYGGGSYYGSMTRSLSQRTMEMDVSPDELGASMGEDIGLGGSAKSVSGSLGAPAGGGGDSDYSQTNIQVEGVDESDIVKTDGRYIFTISNQNLFIVDAYPGKDAQVLAKIEFKSYPKGMYIQNKRLIVYGVDYEVYDKPIYRDFGRRSSYNFFKVFDISNKKEPALIKDLDFEGYYNNSRMVGDYVYVLSVTPTDIWADDVVVPRILEDGVELSTDPQSARCGNCPRMYYVPVPNQSYQYTSVIAINVQDVDKPLSHDVYLLPGGENIYMSQDNLYIVHTRRVSEYQLAMEVLQEIVFPLLSEKEQERIVEIQATKHFILTPDEKFAKISAILERYIDRLDSDQQDEIEDKGEAALKAKYDSIAKELEKTVIHKIGIAKGNLEYKAAGEVTGIVLNQFSMDEHDGFFRIATTKNRTWSSFIDEPQTSYSNLYILDENLKQVGAVEELAPDERIFSVRFMQGRAYMVTYRQTDPLFVIDVSNPYLPRVLGELKIPGFSNYLHPFDQNHIIGLGRETVENEWGGVSNGGVKLSLFDVSDVSQPKEVDTYVLGDAGTSSLALNDHHAFLFSKEKEMLVIPLESWSSRGPIILEENEGIGAKKIMPPLSNFRGAVVMRITQDGFELRGTINHADGLFDEQGSTYDTQVQRSLYIKEILYTVSNKFLYLNGIEDIELLKKVELKKERKQDFEVVN